MPYTTQQDLDDAAGGADRFRQLADFDGDGVADAAMVARLQAEADGWIDAHLRRFSAADLASLRAAPTATIKGLAAAEVIFRMLEKRRTIGDEDLELRKQRAEQLRDMRADELRPADTKTARARFVDNEDDVSREGTKGMW